jgi:cytochrome c oxidase assembly factor CtaG
MADSGCMLLAGPGMPSPPVTVHRLLTAWQFGEYLPAVAFALQCLAIVLYVSGVRRLHRRGRHWSPWRTAAFVAGVATLTIAIVSGLASYDDQVFVVHIAQHLMIMMVAPPLLALGAPVTLALQASPRRAQTKIVRALRHPVARVLTVPLVAAVLYYVSMYVELVTVFYRYSVSHPVVHDLSHVVLFALGCLFWWPMVAVDELPDRPDFGARIFFLFIGMPFEVFLGVAIMGYGSPIAPEHTLADTHAGGAVFWVSSMAITFTAALLILAQWWGQEQRRALREDRHTSSREARRLQVWQDAWAGKPPPQRSPSQPLASPSSPPSAPPPPPAPPGAAAGPDSARSRGAG